MSGRCQLPQVEIVVLHEIDTAQAGLLRGRWKMRFGLFVRQSVLLALFGLGLVACAHVPDTPSLAGRWDATVVVNDVEIPFPFEILDG